jgi:pilus assembly protein CpaB
MRVNSILILVIAIVMGGVAAFLARNWLLSRTQATNASTTSIVVAARQLPFATPLNDNNVVEIPWAAKAVPAGSFSSKKALFKDGRRVTLAIIQQNEPILISKLTGPGQRASLATSLEKDKRAITIRVDDVRGVAGFILPNDRVDVVLIRAATDTSGRRQSDLLLQDVKVIAINQIASTTKDKPIVARAVTLEVTPYQAQIISLAVSVGSLSLILRKSGDPTIVANRPVTETDLSEKRTPPPPKNIRTLPPPPAAPTDATVTIMRNLRAQEYRVIREGE